MNTKTVPVIVPVASSFFDKASPVAKRLGIDARKYVGQVMAGIALHQLEEDPHLWLSTFTFPNRKAAQYAVTQYYRTATCALAFRHQDVSFMEAGKALCERFYAPGAKAAEKKLHRMADALTAAEGKAQRVRKVVNSLAGCAA